MPPVMETVKTVNSLLRTLIGLAAVGLVTIASWLGYRAFTAGDAVLAEKQAALLQAQTDLEAERARVVEVQKQVAQQREQITTLETDVAAKQVEIAEQKVEIERLDTALTLIKVDHRLAEITVLDQGMDEKTGQEFSLIEFVEVNDEGAPIEKPRQFRIQGDLVYVDHLVVKFEDKYIEASDLDRSTSICLFRRIYGEFQQPQEGFVLDAAGVRPTAYARGGQMSEFEKKIWEDFWNIANNPAKAKELGIRAASGEAPFTKVRKGYKYKLLLRSSGGLTFQPGEPVAE